MIRILIADDHELIREGVKKIVRSSDDMTIAGEAATIDQAIDLIRSAAPDIVVLDISMPGHDGLKGLEQIHRHFPAVPVLMLSMHPEARFAIRALRAGAAGYLTKSMAADELITAIRRIMAGANYVSPGLAELLAREARAGKRVPLPEELTAREQEILRLIGAGKQGKEIAAALSISISSVNTYRARIFRKTGMRSNGELIRYALDHGLVA
jgi:two-component system invasion response regulator UvrY